jgi:hypothetical protein
LAINDKLFVCRATNTFNGLDCFAGFSVAGLLFLEEFLVDVIDAAACFDSSLLEDFLGFLEGFLLGFWSLLGDLFESDFGVFFCLFLALLARLFVLAKLSGSIVGNWMSKRALKIRENIPVISLVAGEGIELNMIIALPVAYMLRRLTNRPGLELMEQTNRVDAF